MKTYEAWVVMDTENSVMTEEHETEAAARAEILEKYTEEQAQENGFTVCRLLCSEGQWLECLEEVVF